MLRKRSFTVREEDIELLQEIAKGATRYRGKASTGLRILCDTFRAIKKEGEKNENN